MVFFIEVVLLDSAKLDIVSVDIVMTYEVAYMISIFGYSIEVYLNLCIILLMKYYEIKTSSK
jgi:hypothetical protein